MTNSLIELKNITKKYGEKIIFQNLSISFPENEIIALIGPNGCGKSTLLNIIAGIDKDYKGEKITEEKNYKTSYCFQSYGNYLLPWRTNLKNLTLPLELAGLSKKVQLSEVETLMATFNIKLDLRKYPYQLSGGQRQILAFLNTLIQKTQLILLDEAFSALDYQNTLLMRKGLLEHFFKYSPTIIIISHNIEEALQLASTVIILSSTPTRVVQIIKNDTPKHRRIFSFRNKDFLKNHEIVLDAFKSTIND